MEKLPAWFLRIFPHRSSCQLGNPLSLLELLVCIKVPTGCADCALGGSLFRYLISDNAVAVSLRSSSSLWSKLRNLVETLLLAHFRIKYL